MLARLTGTRNFFKPRFSEKLFELECYLSTAAQIASLNRKPIPENLGPGGRFEPLWNPGAIGNGSYFRFEHLGREGEDMSLYMNASVSSGNRETRVLHSPDIVLVRPSLKILSISECKYYSGSLPLSTYREFIGFLEELTPTMIDPSWHRATPEMYSRIYTTAIANPLHSSIPQSYGFVVQDQMP